MGPVLPLKPQRATPPEMQARAMDNLRFIRQTMERAGTFTAVSGWGEIVMGFTAIIAALVAARFGPTGWVATWMMEAVFAAAIAAGFMHAKSRAAGMPLISGPLRKLVLSFSPPMLVGALLTVLFMR